MFYTNDPVADFKAYDHAQTRWLSSRPRCDFCGEPIQDEHYYKIGAIKYCPDCIENHFRVEIDD